MEIDAPAPADSKRIDLRVWLFAAGWVAVVGLIVVLRVWALVPHVWDLGFFVHGLGAVAREGVGAPVPFAGWSLLQDHFSPLLLVLTPFARFDWSPYLLVGVQVAAIAVSIPIAYRMAARSVGTRRSAWLRTLAYAFSPVLLFAVFFDIHASVLATPLLLLLFQGVDQDRSRQLVLAGTAAALLREDIAFFVLALAVLFYKENPRAMRALVAVSAVTLVVGRAVAAGGDSSVMPPHLNFSYAYVDLMDPFGTLDGAVGALFVAGADSLLLVLAAIVLPWIGYGRLDGRVLVFGALTAAPFLFSDYAVTKSVDSHYYFALAPILFWASIRGRRDDLEPSVSSRSLLPVLALAFALIGGPLVTGLLARDSLTAVEIVDRAASNSDRYRSTQEVLACLPGDYSVAVGPELVPHVARHATVWQWPQPVDSAVWILGGNRFVMQPVDRDGIPDAVVFSTSSYDPADLGLERVEADPASGLSVFVTSGPAAGAVRSCLQSG